MNPRQNNSLTLLELIIAMVLLSLVVLSFSSMDIFSRFEVLSSDRRAKLHNEVSYVLEHMTKEIGKAIGSAGISGQEPVFIIGGTFIQMRIDTNGNGKLDAYPDDRIIAYRWTNSTYKVEYCSDYIGTCAGPGYQTLSQKISNFTASPNPIINNYVDVSLTACYEPTGTTYPCGTRDNPNVTMQTRIKMPSVSTH